MVIREKALKSSGRHVAVSVYATILSGTSSVNMSGSTVHFKPPEFIVLFYFRHT